MVGTPVPPPPPSEQPPAPDDESPLKVLILVGIVAALAVAAIFWLFLPKKAPTFSSPNFVDVLIDNRWVIAAIRATMAIIAVYILLSVGVWIQRGQWLKGIGPLQVDEAVNELAADYQAALDQLADADRTIDRLTTELAGWVSSVNIGGNDADVGPGGAA